MKILTSLRANISTNSYIDKSPSPIGGGGWKASGNISLVQDSPFSPYKNYSISVRNSYLYLSSLYSLDMSKEYTISFWSKLAQENEHIIIGNKNNFHSILRLENSINLRIDDDNWRIDGKDIYNLQEWNHIALTLANGTNYLFLNGVLQGTCSGIFRYIYSIGYSGFFGDAPRDTGLIEDLVILEGTALWTSNFEVPKYYLLEYINTLFENNDNSYGVI